MPIIPLSEDLELQASLIVYGGASAASAVLPIDTPVERYLIRSATGPITMLAGLSITAAAGTPAHLTTYTFEYTANMNFNGNTLTIMGTVMPTQLENKKCLITAVYDKTTTSWDVKFLTDFSESDIVSTGNIEDGAVTNVKVAAGLDGAKLGAGTVPDTALAASIGLFKVASGNLTSPEILTLNTAPITLIPAVVGKIIIPLHVNITIIGGAATAIYATNTILQIEGAVSSPRDPLFEFDCLAHPIGSSPNFAVPAKVANPLLANNAQYQMSQAIKMTVKTGNPTAGDSTLNWQIVYYEI